MRRTKKLVGLKLKEISGVDHPASLFEGWAVMKSSENGIERAVAEAVTIPTDNSMEKNVEDNTQYIADDMDIEIETEDVSKELSSMQKQLDSANEVIATLQADAELQKATARVQDWVILPGLETQEFAEVFKSIKSATPEQSEVLEKVLDSCAIAFGEVGILKQVGSDASPDADTAYGQMEAIAKAMVEEGTATSFADGLSKVAVDQPELYSAYVAEQRGA